MVQMPRCPMTLQVTSARWVASKLYGYCDPFLQQRGCKGGVGYIQSQMHRAANEAQRQRGIIHLLVGREADKASPPGLEMQGSRLSHPSSVASFLTASTKVVTSRWDPPGSMALPTHEDGTP